MSKPQAVSGSSTLTEWTSDIKNRALDAVVEIPPTLRYCPEDIERPGLNAEILYNRILIRVEYLQSLFFVERLL